VLLIISQVLNYHYLNNTKYKNMMKKLFLLFAALILEIVCFAQTDSVSTKVDTLRSTTIDERLNNIELRLEILDIDLSLKNRYKMYQTENIYNLLKLDTKTGKIWQVQWNLDSAKEGTWEINNYDLSQWSGGYGSNSFELYPTKNMYQFILIDKTDGRMWHVQWGTGGDNERWIRRIY
jgi:hypothetical protein